MPSHVTSSGPSSDGRTARWSWLLPAATFLVGCLLGGVLVAAGAGGAEEADVPSRPAAAADSGEDRDTSEDAPEDAAEDADPDAAGLYVRVPDSCVQTAEDATSLVAGVDRVVDAVAELEPERLRQTVDDVQQLRDGVEDVAAQCRAAAEQRLEDEAGAAGGAPATPAS